MAKRPPRIRPSPTPSIRPLRAATCAYCSATLLKISTPVLNHSTFGVRPVRYLHSHEVGADEERKQRADDGEKYTQSDRRGRQGRCARAGEVVDRPTSSQGLAVNLCCDSHHAMM